MTRQTHTPPGDTVCPDCGQRLSEPQRPCGSLDGEPVWCATCEDCRPQAAPDPITVDWLRALLERHQVTQREAASLVKVEDRTMRRWCAGDSPMPWAAAELLRRLLRERAKPSP